MIRILLFVTSIIFGVITPAAIAQVKDFAPVTQEMLINPSPNDWLMTGRTYDHQRFSPLNQINRQNVAQLGMAWVRGMGPGGHETIPLVYRGVMYVVNPGAVGKGLDTSGIMALDATNGDLIWEYRRKLPPDIRDFLGVVLTTVSRNISIYEDLILWSAPDGYVVGLDARTGALRWETMVHDYKSLAQNTSGPVVAQGTVMTGRGCSGAGRANCFVAGHDARTGKELWKFYTPAGPGDPGDATWGTVPAEKRETSPWGIPAGYDPVRKLAYWGVANAQPHTRWERHGGNVDDIPRVAPADLYSDSVVALDPITGKLAWYYQHLPGDDWDSDWTQERILLRTPFNPDPNVVKWINPRIPRGQEREVIVTVGEPGGLAVLDRDKGEFLWTAHFPFDTPDFHLSRIDVETGKTYLNWDKVQKEVGKKYTVCYLNTKGFFAMAYHPAKNSLYIPYHDRCFETSIDQEGNDRRTPIYRPGSDPNAFTGLAKVNMATGQIQRLYTQRFSTQGAVLATAGDVIFWGDMNRRFRAFDADSGKILWEKILGDGIQNSTITYSVNGKQYVAVLTGHGLSASDPLVPELKTQGWSNAIYVFALP